tara:strand:- start:15748 stop:18012 length:2265 start_codon:yes stop_codon:yes gene_type:complete
MNNSTQFPRQNIPSKEKNEEWVLNCVNSILSYQDTGDRYRNEKVKDHENYLIAEGHFDTKQFEYVTDMYGITAPARLVNYPIIMPKLDLLVGELVSQPLSFTAYVTNRSAIRRKNEKKIQVAAEFILRPLRRKMEEVTGTEFKDEDLGLEIPEDVKAFQEYKFRDAIEDQIHVGLNYLIQKYSLKDVFKRGFYDMGVTSKEFYRTIIKNGDPFPERLDPRTVIYDPDSEKETIQDCLYAGVDKYYTINEIIDRLGHILTKKNIDYLEELQNMDSAWFADNNVPFSSYIYSQSTSLKIRVVDVQWRSIRMMKYKKSENKFDPEVPYYKMLADDYKEKKGEDIVRRPIVEIWRATKIGHELLLEWGPKPNQYRFEENYAESKLDYFGVIKTNFNGRTLSIVDSLKNIQILYNVVMYHIELCMARAGGKSIVYDVSQKPKNTPLSDVLYHAKNSGLILINSKQEGQQISTFNQFQQIDFTLSNSVQQLVNLKLMLEDTAEKLTGISAARSGIQKSGDLVGVTERNVLQSTTITAPMFDLHYRIVGDVLQDLANKMRMAWANEGRMANVFGDMGMQTFKIDKAISKDEYGIFIKNSSKEVQDKALMLQLIERYSSTGAIEPLAAIQAVRGDSATEVEGILKGALKEMRAQQIELQEREIAAQEQKNEIDATKIQVPVNVAQINADSSIQVAQLNNQTKVQMQTEELLNDQDMQNANKNADLDKMLFESDNEDMEHSDIVPPTQKQPVDQRIEVVRKSE